MPSIWLKMSNSKILHFKFYRFFRQSVTKIMGKTAIWTILCFSPLPPLNNVEEQWAKLVSANVIGSQHGIGGGRGGILNTLFKIPKTFCHWLQSCKFLKTLDCLVQHLTNKHSIYLEWKYVTFVDIDCLINYTVLKLLQPLQDFIYFHHSLLCQLIFWCYQIILWF